MNLKHKNCKHGLKKLLKCASQIIFIYAMALRKKRAPIEGIS